jgi:radical SAM-linked protein
MREERLVALRGLDRMTREREAQIEAEHEAEREAEREGQSAPDLVPIARLRGRMAASNLDDDSAFKHAAEAPYSKVRLFFAKRGTLRFLSQLDLVRIIPRMFRRAGVVMGFSRGFSPQPRMSFGPAIALGMAADEDVLDCDLLLERSAEDMAGLLDGATRQVIADELLARLRPAAPPGMVLLDARIVPPGEKKLGELVAGADFAVELDRSPAELGELAARVDATMKRDELSVTREQRVKKKRKGRRREVGTKTVTIDLRERLVWAGVDVDGARLRFRLRTDLDGANARPREIAALLLGEPVEDHRMSRERLLARASADAELESLRELGGVWRAPHRRHVPALA